VDFLRERWRVLGEARDEEEDATAAPWLSGAKQEIFECLGQALGGGENLLGATRPGILVGFEFRLRFGLCLDCGLSSSGKSQSAGNGPN
jgi:hypothetical protein